MTRAVRRGAIPGGIAVFGALMIGAAFFRARLTSPPETLLVEDRHGSFLGELNDSGSETGYWPLRELPPRVVKATLALEDRRFDIHPGVDPISFLRAAIQNLARGRRVSGASTIAMQVARMQNPGARGYFRKALEALTAWMLVHRYGREAVLAEYLKLVPYGNRIHGIAYAARRYLDKPVEDLSWAEIAFLSALPQAPARMNPFHPAGRRRAIARGSRLLERLRRQGVISRGEYEIARTEISRIRLPTAQKRPPFALHALLELEQRFRDPRERELYAGRPIVETTLDLELQSQAAAALSSAVSRFEELGVANAAAIVVDRASGEVRAWVGSSGYFDARRAGAIDYARVSRSAGSTLKPFLYALALERGTITPATILDDLARSAGGITNADDLFLGPMIPRVALANSRNVPAANLLARVGLDEGYGFLRDLRLHDGEEPARRYGLGLAIGGLPVTLERLVRAYLVLARDGEETELRWHRRQKAALPRRVLSAETAREVTLFLSDPLARLPSFPRMGASEYAFPVAVKTGTSSNYRDGWTVAYSSRAVVGVWVGHPDFRSMNHVTGFRAAASIAHDILTLLHGDQLQGLDDLAFPSPRGYRPVRICALSGQRASDNCDRVFREWFPPGQEPVETCNSHVEVAVDRRTGIEATIATPKRFLQAGRALRLDPRYGEWARRSGLTFRGTEKAEAPSDRSFKIRITSPEPGSVVLRDPETPAEMSTLELAAQISPAPRQVLWLVDGRPFRISDYPQPVRWRLEPGAHTFEARVPYVKTEPSKARVEVR